MSQCCFKCVFCGVSYFLIDENKHDICQDFYKYTLEEMIRKLDKQLQLCYKMKKQITDNNKC